MQFFEFTYLFIHASSSVSFHKYFQPRDSATIVYADIDHKKSKGPENVENPMINETTYTQIKCVSYL